MAERRQINGYRIDAIEEVEAEAAFLDLDAKIAVGAGDEAGLDGARGVAADPDEAAVLEHLQKLGLGREVEAADLVEEQGALVRLLNAAALGGVRPGKGALLVAEELGLHQAFRNGRTAHLYKRSLGAAGEDVQEACAHLFAGAALSLQEDGNPGICDAFQLLPNTPHGWRSPKGDLQRRQIVEFSEVHDRSSRLVAIAAVASSGPFPLSIAREAKSCPEIDSSAGFSC